MQSIALPDSDPRAAVEIATDLRSLLPAPMGISRPLHLLDASLL